MPKIRKKPVVIEAVRFTRHTWDEVKKFTNGQAHSWVTEKYMGGNSSCIIPTLEGELKANEGDWIIKGVNGEFYPCKADIFQKTYELV
jgi:hypothetical protein